MIGDDFIQKMNGDGSFDRRQCFFNVLALIQHEISYKKLGLRSVTVVSIENERRQWFRSATVVSIGGFDQKMNGDCGDGDCGDGDCGDEDDGGGDDEDDGDGDDGDEDDGDGDGDGGRTEATQQRAKMDRSIGRRRGDETRRDRLEGGDTAEGKNVTRSL
ncbi:secreted acidic protein 2-like [Cynara cardunculus var. scolymus]|uniref:secreted acidic protein 2-like n=1 Tax=Cynara cardunculus var. scolymus TaxID=59895 RepID=UPI000D625CC5|nr:secreted acidic protein 2-like [Cynara cardunculus var. scolymus]